MLIITLILRLGRLRGVLSDARGALGVLAALSLPLVIGVTGLAYDVNQGHAQRVVNQRVADMAALGAAMAYKAKPDPTILTPTARDIVFANDLDDASVSSEVVDDFPVTGSKAVRVTVTTTLPYTFSRVVGMAPRFTVLAEAYASLSSQPLYAPPCFMALANATDAFTVSGGATVSASTCSVAAVGSIDNQGNSIVAHDIVSGSGNITNNYGALNAQSLRYAGTFNNPSWNTNVPPPSKQVRQATTLTDPWAENSELAGARMQIGAYNVPATLTNPVTAPRTGSAKDWSFDYSPRPWIAPYRTSADSNEYVVPTDTYYIKRLSTAGGIKVTFGDGSRIYVDQGFANGGGSNVSFGNSTVYVNGGFDTGSNGITQGTGDLWIGSGSVTFQGTTRKGDGMVWINAPVNLGGGQTLYLGAGRHAFGSFNLGGGGSVAMGEGNFSVMNGITIGGGSELSIGDGNVLIGPNSANQSINLAGSARFFMGDGTFSANGAIVTAGGSRLVFGKTANHYINYGLNVAGAVLFGAGRYTIAGDFTNGTGGTTWPYASSLTGKVYGDTLEGVSVSGYDMAGVYVTFVLSGTLNLGGGARTKLIAATTSTTNAQIADMLVHSLSGNDTRWSGGSSNAFAGTVYLPNSRVTMSGGNTTIAGKCFTLIASKVALTGGAATGSACTSTTSSTSAGAGSIKLVK